jgi:DNA polymerase-1
VSVPILLVDAPNIVMRCAFGGAMPAEHAVPLAVSAIRRAANVVRAEFLIIAFDAPHPTWREELCPAYKSHRTVDTTPFTAAARVVFERQGWFCLTVPGFEADDVIATMIGRLKRRSDAAILSSDSDLLALASDAENSVTILRPVAGGNVVTVTASDVVGELGVEPWQIAEYKALAGDVSDGIGGVPGIGAKRAARLLQEFRTVGGVFAAADQDKLAKRVLEHRAIVELAHRLTTLRTDVPIDPIPAARCYYRPEVAA